jgi:hypothetical protein
MPLSMRNIYKKAKNVTFVQPSFITIDVFFIIFAAVGTVLDLTRTLMFYRMDDNYISRSVLKKRKTKKRRNTAINDDEDKDYNIEPIVHSYSISKDTAYDLF